MRRKIEAEKPMEEDIPSQQKVPHQEDIQLKKKKEEEKAELINRYRNSGKGSPFRKQLEKKLREKGVDAEEIERTKLEEDLRAKKEAELAENLKNAEELKRIEEMKKKKRDQLKKREAAMFG